MARIVVVGAGILGTMHALRGIYEGHEVIHVERDKEARSASVRNFGLIWVSGRNAGDELQLALRSRELWEEIGSRTEIGFRANGSLTIARNDEEFSLLHEAVDLADSDKREFTILSKAETENLEPLLRGEFRGALKCNRDAVVEPSMLFEGLHKKLRQSERYSWFPEREIIDFASTNSGIHFYSNTNEEFAGDIAVVCPGSFYHGFLGEFFKDQPLRNVRLQMAATKATSIKLHHSVADIDSLRYYPAFKNLSLQTLPPQSKIAEQYKMQLLLAPRLDGTFTIGDTHEYEEPFNFELDEAPYQHLTEVINGIFGVSFEIERRWDGIYSQSTNDEIYFRKNFAPSSFIVTGGGGRGNTLAPVIAEETFKEMAAIELVIFDIAGTTAQDDGLVVKAFQEAMIHEGVLRDSEQLELMTNYVNTTMGQRKIDVFRTLCDGNQTQAERAHDRFILKYLEMVNEGELVEIPGVNHLFRDLRGKGIGVALTSGFPRRIVDSIINALNWRGEIDLSVASDEVDNGRPAPDLILRSITRYETLRQKTISSDSIIVVGDTESDMKAAYAARAKFIVGVTSGAHTQDELLANGATHVFKSAPEIVTLF